MSERKFECTLCGDCCRRPGVVVLGSDELEPIAEHLQTTVAEVIDTCEITPRDGNWWIKLRGRSCPFLKDDKCSIQAVKPRQCATYPFWPEVLEDDATWEAEAAHCPGIGRGPVWTADAIEAMLETLGD